MGGDTAGNFNTYAVQKAWANEAVALGVRGFVAPPFFQHVSGCDTCRAARNAVREARATEASRDLQFTEDDVCGNPACSYCYPPDAAVTGPAIVTKAVEPLRPTDLDDLMELSTVFLNLNHTDGVKPTVTIENLNRAIQKISARIEANS